MIELDEIMRQRGDSQFCVEYAQPLALKRTSRCWNQEPSQMIIKHDTLHAYPRNHHVDEQNKLKL